jgi:hypothetical protein
MIKGRLKLGDRLKTKEFGNKVTYMVCLVNGRFGLILIKDNTKWNNIGLLTAQHDLREQSSLDFLALNVNQHHFGFTRVH